jgi:hypothetical protein
VTLCAYRTWCSRAIGRCTSSRGACNYKKEQRLKGKKGIMKCKGKT